MKSAAIAEPLDHPASVSGGSAGLRHIAVIMDGNGRWAKAKGLPRVAGHKKGAESVRAIIRNCTSANISYLTLYAFSAENWRRPEGEVNELMGLLRFYINQELKELHANGVRLRFIGDIARLQKDIRDSLNDAEKLTKNNTKLNLQIALSYGGRQELVHAVRQLAQEAKEGRIAPEEITEEALEQRLYTAELPPPDLLIRTGGEKRLSNFLLWQMAYAEFYFTPVLWPDFGKAELDAAIADFSTRQRRYGGTDED